MIYTSSSKVVVVSSVKEFVEVHRIPKVALMRTSEERRILAELQEAVHTNMPYVVVDRNQDVSTVYLPSGDSEWGETQF